MLPHFLDYRLTDGGEVSLTRQPPFTPKEDSWYSFLLQAESTPPAGGIKSIEKSNDLTGNRNRDLPACSVVAQPITLPRALTAKTLIGNILSDLLKRISYFNLSPIY
jgi:hypothetical protein